MAESLEKALRSQAILRRHLKQVTQSLSEKEALRYEAMRRSGLSLALSILIRQDGPTDEAIRVWEEVSRSRALVLDEMARRHRVVLESEAPGTRELLEDLSSARNRYARMIILGPEPQNPARYRQALGEARAELERAERELAARGASFLPLDQPGSWSEIEAALPAESALVAYLRYEQLPSPGIRGEAASPIPSFLALVTAPGRGDPVLVPLGATDNIRFLVDRWRQQASTEPLEPSALQRYRKAAEALRRAIWDPVESHLTGSSQVFIVPDGALHLVSFASLPVLSDRYLLETVAGVDTLILTLWPVSDHETRVWMRDLYEARLEGRSTAEAVRAASLHRLEARRPAGVTTHPYFWGAFVATGSWN